MSHKYAIDRLRGLATIGSGDRKSFLPIWLVEDFMTQKRVKVSLQRAIKEIKSTVDDDLIDIEAIGPRKVTGVLLGIFKQKSSF